MQKRYVAIVIFMFLFAIIFTLMVSGFSVKDFLEETSHGIAGITGRATTGITGVNLTLAGRNGDIYYVENLTTQSINENASLNISISFYLSDPDGNGAEPARARLNLTKTNGSTDANRGTVANAIFNYTSTTSGGCFSTGNINTTVTNLTCWTRIWWFDQPGQWNISVGFVESNGSFAAQNFTHNFTLAATSAIQIFPSNLTFAGTGTGGDDNLTSDNDPIIVNNTGNVDYATGNVRINITNLVGEVTKTQIIPAFNFSVDVINSTYAGAGLGECRDGNSTHPANNSGNSSFVAIGSSFLRRGNHSMNNGTAGIEHIFVCLNDVPQGLSGQAYSTLEMGSWVIDVI